MGSALTARPFPWQEQGAGVPAEVAGDWSSQEESRLSSGAGQAGSHRPRQVSSGGTGNVCGLSTAEKPGGIPQAHVVWEATLHLPCPPGLPVILVGGSSQWNTWDSLPWDSASSCPSAPFAFGTAKWVPPTQPAQGGKGLPWASGESAAGGGFLTKFLFCENSRFICSCKKRHSQCILYLASPSRTRSRYRYFRPCLPAALLPTFNPWQPLICSPFL